MTPLQSTHLSDQPLGDGVQEGDALLKEGLLGQRRVHAVQRLVGGAAELQDQSSQLQQGGLHVFTHLHATGRLNPGRGFVREEPAFERECIPAKLRERVSGVHQTQKPLEKDVH